MQSVTVPRGYNPVRLIEEFPGIQIHWVRPDIYELGATNIMTPSGNRVRCYNSERSIADLIKQRKLGGVDAQLARDAIGGYFNSRDKDLHELARMCEALGVGASYRYTCMCCNCRFIAYNCNMLERIIWKL